MSELAAGTGWSSRHLTSRFRAEIGEQPELAARLRDKEHGERTAKEAALFTVLRAGGTTVEEFGLDTSLVEGA